MINEKQEYQKRRNTLAKKIPKDAVALIAANQETLRNGDVHFRFRQDSDFYYLTGFEEPDALLVILGQEEKSYLFNRSRNKEQEQWTGKRLEQEDAPSVLGVTEAYPLTSLTTTLPTLLADKNAIYYTMGKFSYWDNLLLPLFQSLSCNARSGLQTPDAIVNVSRIIGEMRLYKSETEIALLRKAAHVSVHAHLQALKEVTRLEYEYQLEAVFLSALGLQGCRNVAYDSIVGAGANSCILHYTANNQRLSKGDLVLVDAGGEWQNYASDITRTYPVSGQFTAAQKAIYSLVLKAQKAGIACIKPGIAWSFIQETMVKILTEGLVELGLLQGKIALLLANQAYKTFYMHSSGHWLGLDVHDSGLYKIHKQWRNLEPGMVLTVEPGIYIPGGLDGVDARFWNIGVRIEDDILVTPQGHENLTKALPVEIDDLEDILCGR